MNNYSRQREIILQVIKNNRTHPTAEQIYNMVKEQDEKISRSTVYRNINILLNNGTIRKITISNKPDRYDFVEKLHYHVVCKECGNIYDFYYKFNQIEIARKIKKEIGFITNVDDITITGICNKCQSKNKFKEES